MINIKITMFIKTYNEKIYETTGVQPVQLIKDLELRYIIDSINKQNKTESITLNYKLTVYDKVGLIQLKKIFFKNNIKPYS
jgi:hypothetical protein